ncbi:hypothetical protein FB451DRAFT_1460667, partial [Mycena latifolia]
MRYGSPHNNPPMVLPQARVVQRFGARRGAAGGPQIQRGLGEDACSLVAGAAGAAVRHRSSPTSIGAGSLNSQMLSDDLSAEILETTRGGQLHGVSTEYRSFTGHFLVAIPTQLSYEEAATLPCTAVTAYNALTGGYHPVKAGDTVLILGTGGVSIFALQFAVASGAKITAQSSSEEKLKTVKRLGATHVINYKTKPKWDEEVLKLTGGLGVDRVIEAQPAVDIVFTAIRQGLNIRGVLVGSVKQFKDMNKLTEANVEMTRPVIAKVFPCEQAQDAYAYFESQAHVGKGTPFSRDLVRVVVGGSLDETRVEFSTHPAAAIILAGFFTQRYGVYCQPMANLRDTVIGVLDFKRSESTLNPFRDILEFRVRIEPKQY